VHAIYDVAPYPAGETPEPFMYWEDGLSAATALIKRYVFVVVSFLIFVPDYYVIHCAKIPVPALTKTNLFITAVALASFPFTPTCF
jgi:hypothetical protein